MLKPKFLFSLLFGLAIVFAQVGAVHAAPGQDTALITGTVQNVVVETNSDTGVSTVVVTWIVNGVSQTIHLSVETAAVLTLILVDDQGNPILDANGHPTADTTWIGWDIDIDPNTILPEEPVPPVEPPTVEEPQHPVGSKIADFFSKFFDVNYELVMSSHSNGFGFGVITQALWMTEKLGGDTTLFQTILDAKKTQDYSLVTLPDGSVPQNWGQLKKALLLGETDENLGDIVSGSSGKHENSGTGNGNGKPDNVGNGNSNGNNGNGKPENPGNGNGKPENTGNGNNNNVNSSRPGTPPGQDKDKNKDNSGNGKTK